MKPKTPLPWGWEFFATNPPTYCQLAHLDADKKIHPVLIVDERHRVTREDASYLMHAANLYPELVEALQTIAAQSSWIPTSTAKADCMAAIASLALRRCEQTP